MGKTKTSTRFPDRPKPPNREEIINDLTAAKLDDVAFKCEDNESNASSTETSVLPSAEGSVDSDSHSVDAMYKQVRKLLEMEKQLKKEPEVIEEKYIALEQQGEEVSDAISALRKVAETVEKKS